MTGGESLSVTDGLIGKMAELSENIRVNDETNTAHVVQFSSGVGFHRCYCGWVCRSTAVPDGGKLENVEWCETCQKVIEGGWG